MSEFPPLVDAVPETVQTPAVGVAPKRRSPRVSARKGADFEQQVAEWLATRLDDDGIERRVKNGKNDRGDITGVKTLQGGRVVLEAKNRKALALSGWVDEAEIERGNDDALIGVVVHKRINKGPVNFGETYVTMTLETFARLLEGGVDL